MKPNRRELIVSLSALPLLSACKDVPAADTSLTPAPERPPEPPDWEAPGVEDLDLFAWGVQSGDVSESGAMLSLHTLASAVDLTLMRGEGETWVEDQQQQGLSPVEGYLHLDLTGLAPDTVYCGILSTPEGARSGVFRFRTSPDLSSRRLLRIGATSCLGSANPGWANLGFVEPERLDAMLLLGDTVYADGSVTLEDYRAEWSVALSTPTLRQALLSTSVIATWDDHEVSNDWYLGQNVSQEQYDAALQAYREALPQGQGPSGGIWRKLSWGGVLDLFVLDCRSERQPGVDQIISQEQLDWFTQELAASTARFKIIMTSVHMTDHSDLFGTVYEHDRWQGYPAQRGEMIAAAEGVPGVLWVTGDMHYAGVCHLSPGDEPGFEMVEVAAGPSGSRINELVTYFEGSKQYPILLAQWCWALLELDAGLGTVRVAFIGDSGEILAEQTLSL